MTRTLAVTGAYGYLGSRIRAEFQRAGWSTVALVRTPREGDDAVRWSLNEPTLHGGAEDVDALVHCAYDFAPRNVDDLWRVNVEGTSALLRSGADAGIPRMVVLSSMSAYAGTEQVYGRIKLAIEEATLEVGAVAVRPGLVYGDQPAGMAGALVALTKLPVVPVVGGRAVQFPVHEDDFVGAVREVLETPEWRSEVMGIAQPTPISFRELLAALAARDGRRCRFLPVPWRAVHLALRLVERTGASLPLRSDSLLGLVKPAQSVPRSTAFPRMLETLRPLEAHGREN